MELVPKEPLKIVRRFNAGNRAIAAEVPKGRLNEGSLFQPSLWDLFVAAIDPTVNCRAIFECPSGTEALEYRTLLKTEMCPKIEPHKTSSLTHPC